MDLEILVVDLIQVLLMVKVVLSSVAAVAADSPRPIAAVAGAVRKAAEVVVRPSRPAPAADPPPAIAISGDSNV